MSKSKGPGTYSGGHAMMLGLLALAGVVWWLRQPDAQASAPLGQLPG